MLAQMQKQEEADVVKDGKDQKRALKREETAEKIAQAAQRKTTRAIAGQEVAGEVPTVSGTDEGTSRRGRGKQVKLKKENSKITDYINKEDLENKAGKGTTIQQALEAESGDGVKPGDIGVQNLRSARQPDLVTGGAMRAYQLEGLEWLTSLYENGLNGILADEMGLGKTLQTISFLAFLREKGVNGPFLIAAPLSTTSNWVDEFKRWTPSVPVVLYHGTKQDREEIRNKRLRNPGGRDFPVICTSYEICMNDRKFLAHYGWKYIIIDEGHRIKNLNCRLIRELQSYQSANRLLITGTPLQNNLAELWSLLHFLMPEIFDKLESFESWFDFSAVKERNGYEQILSESRKKTLVTSLHAILKPFLLRRIKADVEHNMPKKREYVLYAPLTAEQRELYQEILHGNSRTYLEEKVVEVLSRNVSGANTPTSARSVGSKRKRKATHGISHPLTPNKSSKSSRASTPATETRSSMRNARIKKPKTYEEVSDTAYFKQLEAESQSGVESEDDSSDEPEHKRLATLAMAKKFIAQKKLQNPIMQLRLCCNSPHNFYDPFSALDSTANGDDSDHELDYSILITASGKMALLDRLLGALLSSPENHKILIFSQFKTQLDLLALYLENVRNLSVCRIDGGVAQVDRAEQIRTFNSDPDARVFLLSTRSGGQGINLASADTVVLFDSDWNPQQDLQAQDRAHRIGQRRNVIVYRLASRNTVEEMLLEKADGKRRLEKLVIQKGRFQNETKRQKEEDVDDDELNELQALLRRDDGERYDFGAAEKLLTDEDLIILTDRSEDAYIRAEKGLDSGNTFKSVETKKDGSGLLEQMSK